MTPIQNAGGLGVRYFLNTKLMEVFLTVADSIDAEGPGECCEPAFKHRALGPSSPPERLGCCNSLDERLRRNVVRVAELSRAGGGGDARAGKHLLEQGRLPWALRRSAPPAPGCDAEAWTAYRIVYEGE